MALPIPGEMQIWDHLRELRKCIVRSVWGVVLGTILGYTYWRELWNFLTVPLHKYAPQVELINTAPVEAFLTSIKIAMVAGVIISSPWVLWNVWKFIAPALFNHEKSILLPVFFSSLILFLGGAAFAFFVILPYGLAFLANYTMGAVKSFWKQGEYASFLLEILFAFGLTFEMPLFAWVLARLGFINDKTLIKIMPYAIVIIFIVAAVLTPPDPVTQILLAIPLCILYGISIAAVKWLIPKGESK